MEVITMAIMIEILGSPDAGKTTALKTISERLTHKGIPNEFIIETRGKNLFSKTERGTLSYNVKIGDITCNRIYKILNSTSAEIILIDKGFVDYLYFIDYYLQIGKCTQKEANEAMHLYDNMCLMPDKIIILTCNPEIATKRCKDAPETRTVKIQNSINSLNAFFQKWTLTPKFFIDTSYMSKEEVVIAIESVIDL